MQIRRAVRWAARLGARLGLFMVGAGAFAGGPLSTPVASASTRGESIPAQASQAGPNQAGLVIRFSDSRVVTRCVAFTEPQITGDELLQESGLVAGMGVDGRVCSIDNQGCPADDCWCKCPFPECEYWAYYHLVKGAWVYSNTGASWSTVQPGAVEGWSWGEGDTTTGIPPPRYTFEEICLSSSPESAPAAAQQPASAGNGAATRSDAAGAPPQLAVKSRAFNRNLLPGYAMFVVSALVLLAAGAWVIRRRAAPRVKR